MRSRRFASAALIVAGALLAGGCGGSSGSKSSGGCSDVEKPKPRAAQSLQPPSRELAAGKTYRVEVDTNCGDFTITLDPRTSPKTTASFVALVRRGYFDDTIFHRIVPDFVIQGGDPTQKGGGGPGYSTVDKPPPTTRYVRNTVAMAKTETESPGTAGSQFFVVTRADAQLPPDYAILGKVTSGQDVVARIGRLGDPQSGKPTRTVAIDRTTVQTS